MLLFRQQLQLDVGVGAGGLAPREALARHHRHHQRVLLVLIAEGKAGYFLIRSECKGSKKRMKRVFHL